MIYYSIYLFTDKFQSHYEYSNKLDIQMTQKMVEAKNYLADSYSLLLYGRAGEGKTTAAFRIVKCLVDEQIVKNERCATVYQPEDIKEIKFTDVDLLLIDDIFGKHNAEASKLVAWRSFFSTLNSCVAGRKIRIIFASRMHIYLEYKKELDGHGLFSRTVELTSSDLSSDEKKHILLAQLHANERDISAINIDECIAHKETDVGFPLCAQQFASYDSLYIRKADYFAKPYNYYFEQNIQNLDEQSSIALLYVFYKENKLEMRDLDVTKMTENSKNSLIHIAKLRGVEKPAAALVKETKQKIIHMKDSYLKCIGKTFSFLHDTMYEAVAKLHGTEFPSEIIKHCTIDYFCQCVCIGNLDSQNLVSIEEDDFTALAERSLCEVLENDNGERLSKHQIFEEPEFVKTLLDMLAENEDTCKDFFSKGLSYNYVGIHAFLYHMILKRHKNDIFIRETLPYLQCSHLSGFDKSCWKCQVKSEALAGACGANRNDIYMELRNDSVEITPFCLYKAVENEKINPDFVQVIINDLKKEGKYQVDNQELLFCLGMSLKNEQTFKILEESGLHSSTEMLHFAVKLGDNEVINALIAELKKENRWIPDDMYVSRALTEAHATCKDVIYSVLVSAGAKLTIASVYWAIIEHGYEEVLFVIESLKENDLVDPESYEMAWSMAMAMKNEDKRILQLLEKENSIPTTALVYALSTIGYECETIQHIIDELKLEGRWDYQNKFVAGAYMESCRRSDKRLTAILEKEGARITPACLNDVVLNSVGDIDGVIETLKANNEFDPANKYIARAFVWSIEYKDKSIYTKLISEGLCLTMACLVSAVRSSKEVLVSVISGLKEENKWLPEDNLALEALNAAFIKPDKLAYEILITEGLSWKHRNLYVAVECETVYGLKQIVKHMKNKGLIDANSEDIQCALSLASSLKDKRKIKLLIANGISPTNK